MLTILAVPILPLAGGAFSLLTGEDTFLVGVIIGAVLLVIGMPIMLIDRAKSRGYRRHGDELELDDMWSDLTTDDDIQLQPTRGRLYLRLGRTKIEIGSPWTPCHYEPEDVRAIAERLERSCHPRCREVGTHLRRLADHPRLSSWPTHDI